MSTGMASEKEIDEAVRTAQNSGCDNLALLHCISSYPAPIDQANIKQVVNIAKRFNVTTGLSDHTLGTTASIVSGAVGACLIEKHFTLNRNDKGPDSEFSIEPKDLKKLCRETKDAWLSLGKEILKDKKLRKETKFLDAHYTLSKIFQKTDIQGDIRKIRPGMGLAPKYFERLIGKINKNVFNGKPVSLKDLEQSGEEI